MCSLRVKTVALALSVNYLLPFSSTVCALYKSLYILYIMCRLEYTVKNVTDTLDADVAEIMQEVMQAVNVDDDKDVTAALLFNKLNKTQLSEFLERMTDAVVMCRTLLKGAINVTDAMKTEHISFQKQIIEQQNELLKRKSEQLEAVPATVKTELQNYCNAAKKCLPVPSSSNNVISITAEQVKKAVKSAVAEDDRSRNVMMFGVTEEGGEILESKVLDILEQVDEKPRVAECRRMGEAKSEVVRPIKVVFYSADTAQRVLRKSGRLKKTENHHAVFLSADRTIEERATRRQLVEQLKQKRKQDPELYYFVRNDKICSRSKG